jgi:hypothetical protein
MASLLHASTLPAVLPLPVSPQRNLVRMSTQSNDHSASTMQQWALRGGPPNQRPNLHDEQIGQDSNLPPESLEVEGGEFRIQWQQITNSPHGVWSGKSRGMEILSIDTGAINTVLLPDRGMGIWKCTASSNHREIEFGWQSPVDGPVHSSLVPWNDASGIGWLEGFDEFLVRCGLGSNGAPEFHPNGTVKYPLHGRIANLPARCVELRVDREAGTLDVIGTVVESRFLISTLTLKSHYRFRVNSPVIEVVDTVTNPTSHSASMQLLYHINIGQPIVQAGSEVFASFKSLCPRDARAAEGIDSWNQCLGPTAGYSEQVYFMEATSGWSESMISNAEKTLGLAVHFDTRTLPYHSLWKNTAAIEDGYVVGLEPATGFPNTKSFEEHKRRVVSLASGESRVFRLRLEPLLASSDVSASRERIAASHPADALVFQSPQPEWCSS